MSTCPDVYNHNLQNYTFDLGNGTISYKHPWWFIGPMAFLLAIVSIASVVGNGLVVATIARHRGMRTRTNLLLANLAAADILVGALDMPFSLVALVKGEWSFGVAACQFNAFTTGLALMASIHTLMFISIHKYISMTRPFSRAMTPLRISLMACTVWVWSCVYNLLPFFGMTHNVYKIGATQCGPIIPCTPPQKIHSFLNTSMNFLVPLIVMSFCNFKISRAVGEHMGRMRQTSNMNYRNSVLQQKHITVTLIIVMVCFLACWTPYIIYSCLLVILTDKESVPPILNPIVYWCGYLNSACNPIIYAFRSPSFRQGYLEILCRSQGDTRVGGSFYSGSSLKPFNRNHSDRIHASAYNNTRVERGVPWPLGSGRFNRLQWDAAPRNNSVPVHHQLLPNSGAASRAVLQRLACRSLAQGVLQNYSSRSSPDLRSNQRKDTANVLRRCDTDSCLAVARESLDLALSETRACSFHTIPDENDSIHETVKVIITDADESGLSKTSTPCLRTPSAYVIAIEGDQSIQNANVQVIITDADAKSNCTTPTVSLANGISNISVANSSQGDSKVSLPRIRPISSLTVACKDRSALSLQEISTSSMGKKSTTNEGDERQRGRRHTEAVNRYIPPPVSESKFHSDPGGLALKRLGSVERLPKRKIVPKNAKQSPSTTPLLRNLAPKWRLSIEALDKSEASSSHKNTGKRGSILTLLGKGQTTS
ncbi:hypothetical protein B566_EDAN009207 [Ephemera danica]|nr:hypothetical protein B566_EDAN009207 [Ephemera danica]